MPLRKIQTPNAPQAIGPYSQAIVVGNLLFISGQLPIDPATGAMQPDNIEAQTHQVLKNLSAIAEAAGSSLAAMVKSEVFLIDMAEFGLFNQIYALYFPKEPQPARATVQVAALPKNARIEIACICAL